LSSLGSIIVMTSVIAVLDNVVDGGIGYTSKSDDFWDGNVLLSLQIDKGSKVRSGILISNHFRHG
jgi:hypothetical protein